jgi:hypothetical protein
MDDHPEIKTGRSFEELGANVVCWWKYTNTGILSRWLRKTWNIYVRKNL